jgi:hypothetical protein
MATYEEIADIAAKVALRNLKKGAGESPLSSGDGGYEQACAGGKARPSPANEPPAGANYSLRDAPGLPSAPERNRGGGS